MFYATKKVEKKKDDQKEKSTQNTFVKENLYVLNEDGEVLYQADKSTAIMQSGLPVILKDKEYIVLYRNGEELYKGKESVTYVDVYKRQWLYHQDYNMLVY